MSAKPEITESRYTVTTISPEQDLVGPEPCLVAAATATVYSTGTVISMVY